MPEPSQPSQINFPVTFDLKVMGHNRDDFETFVLDLVQQHIPVIEVDTLRSRPSRGGKYVSVSITILAENREQLDALYHALSAHERVLMVL
jgi:putative lipoic acid-binding regulatory protein